MCPAFTTWDSGRYSNFGIAVDRNLTLKWLFPFRGPHGKVFVRGVEEKATFQCTQKDHVNSEIALNLD
jgi:hypothetical protein